MWLFRSSTESADTSASNIKETTHAERQRNKQINWLRESVPSVSEVERDRKYRTQFPVHDRTITLDIYLSERFPLEPPHITASPPFTHPWVDNQMVVVGCPLLQQFTPHSNLGSVILQIVNEFSARPPQFDTSAIAMTTQPPYPIVPTPYSGPGPVIFYPNSYSSPIQDSLLFTPFSYSSVPHPSVQSYNSNVVGSNSSSPPTGATVASPSAMPTVGSRRFSAAFGYTIPDKLPGISEKNEEELEKFLNDEDAVVLIDKYISQLDLIKNVQGKMESVFQENEELARANVELQPCLDEEWTKLQDKYVQLQSLKENFNKLQLAQRQLLNKYGGRNVTSELKMLSQESDTNSEVIAENFLEQKIDSSSFIQKFLQERKLYHLRSAKMELYKYNKT